MAVQHPQMDEVREAIVTLRRRRQVCNRMVALLAMFLLLAGFAAFSLKVVAVPVQCSGQDMLPTVPEGGIVLVNTMRIPNRQTIVYTNEATGNRLLRVIAQGGDTLSINESTGFVFVNGSALHEPYLDTHALGSCDFTGEITIPEGMLFLMGDQRNGTLDSRSVSVGLFPMDCVEGVAWALWSPTFERLN